jgi:phytoene dehydrogenase-like protein
LPIKDKDGSVSLVVMRETSKQTVAVVGSGMAGLVAAFLIQRDNKCRYSVEVFEKVNNHG